MKLIPSIMMAAALGQAADIDSREPQSYGCNADEFLKWKQEMASWKADQLMWQHSFSAWTNQYGGMVKPNCDKKPDMTPGVMFEQINDFFANDEICEMMNMIDPSWGIGSADMWKLYCYGSMTMVQGFTEIFAGLAHIDQDFTTAAWAEKMCGHLNIAIQTTLPMYGASHIAPAVTYGTETCQCVSKTILDLALFEKYDLGQIGSCVFHISSMVQAVMEFQQNVTPDFDMMAQDIYYYIEQNDIVLDFQNEDFMTILHYWGLEPDFGDPKSIMMELSKAFYYVSTEMNMPLSQFLQPLQNTATFSNIYAMRLKAFGIDINNSMDVYEFLSMPLNREVFLNLSTSFDFIQNLVFSDEGNFTDFPAKLDLFISDESDVPFTELFANLYENDTFNYDVWNEIYDSFNATVMPWAMEAADALVMNVIDCTSMEELRDIPDTPLEWHLAVLDKMDTDQEYGDCVRKLGKYDWLWGLGAKDEAEQSIIDYLKEHQIKLDMTNMDFIKLLQFWGFQIDPTDTESILMAITQSFQYSAAEMGTSMTDFIQVLKNASTMTRLYTLRLKAFGVDVDDEMAVMAWMTDPVKRMMVLDLLPSFKFIGELFAGHEFASKLDVFIDGTSNVTFGELLEKVFISETMFSGDVLDQVLDMFDEYVMPHFMGYTDAHVMNIIGCLSLVEVATIKEMVTDALGDTFHLALGSILANYPACLASVPAGTMLWGLQKE